jgi:hypothetical protein
MEFINKKKIKIDKLPTLLDKFVVNFCKILEKHVKYVVVSGYVSILFGRARATEDIDILIEKIPREKFCTIYSEIIKKGYWSLNAKTRENAFQMMKDGIGIRFAKRKNIIPNAEVKFAKTDLDEDALVDSLTVVLPAGSIRISRIEQQIAYKELVLGSQKDIEDARHLETVFKDKIDKKLLENYRKRLRK